MFFSYFMGVLYSHSMIREIVHQLITQARAWIPQAVYSTILRNKKREGKHSLPFLLGLG